MKRFFKVLSIFLGVLVLVGCGTIKSGSDDTNTNVNTSSEDKGITNVTSDNKSLVLYFSATGNTEIVAKKIAELSGSDIIEIISKEEYTDDDLDYNNSDCRANKEQNDDSARPEIDNAIDVSQYDKIYLGYPIWWGTNPKIILTLIDTVDLSGKTVIPFCTSGGSDITTSVNELKSYNSNISWQDGQRFNTNSTDDEIKTWLESFN